MSTELHFSKEHEWVKLEGGKAYVGVTDHALAQFLPSPVVVERDGGYALQEQGPASIGRVRSFYGNFGVIVRAYTYLCSVGAEGLREISRSAVLNANYLRTQLQSDFDVAFNRPCMHEVVLTATRQKNENGVTANDIAKRLIDFGIHPPTIYFPLIVHVHRTDTVKHAGDGIAQGGVDAVFRIGSQVQIDRHGRVGRTAGNRADAIRHSGGDGGTERRQKRGGVGSADSGPVGRSDRGAAVGCPAGHAVGNCGKGCAAAAGTEQTFITVLSKNRSD